MSKEPLSKKNAAETVLQAARLFRARRREFDALTGESLRARQLPHLRGEAADAVMEAGRALENAVDAYEKECEDG